MNVEARAIGGGGREHAERARLARNAQRARRELVPQLVVPQVLGQAARQPEPAHVASRQSLLAAERAERLPERRHTGRVAVGEPRRQAVEEQVGRALRLRRRRRSPSGLAGLADPRLAAESAGVHRRRHRLEMGLAGHRGVERFQAPGGIEQQRRRVAAARPGEHDLRAQPLQPRALKLVQRSKLGRRQQLERRVRCPSVELPLRGCHRPLPPPRRIGGQLSRACQERRSRCRTPTGLRPVGRALQLVRHRLVRPGRRLRPMPGATIGIGIRIGRVGQRPMHFLAVAKVCGSVGGRAHEWMAEPHPDPELDQPGLLGRPARVPSDPEALGRAPQQAHIAHGFGRRHQQQALGLVRKRANPLDEGPLEAGGHGPRVGEPEPAGELGRRQPARQLQQRQWVAARLGDDLIAHALVQPPRHGRRQQRACVVVGDPFDDHLR